jgi:hypothetical protein
MGRQRAAAHLNADSFRGPGERRADVPGARCGGAGITRLKRGGGNMQTQIARPKQPYFIADECAFRPRSFDHVPIGAWIEVKVADQLIHATVQGFSEQGKIYAVICDEGWSGDLCEGDEGWPSSLTGLHEGDVIEVELRHVLRSDRSMEELFDLYFEMQAVEQHILDTHRDEFEREYPRFKDALHRLGATDEFKGGGSDFVSAWGRAEEEFVARLVAEGRA